MTKENKIHWDDELWNRAVNIGISRAYKDFEHLLDNVDIQTCIEEACNVIQNAIEDGIFESANYTMSDYIVNAYIELLSENSKEKIKELLLKAGYKEIDENVFLLREGYKVAKDYLSIDGEMYNFLNDELTEDEKKNLVFESEINIKDKIATWKIGHCYRNTENLVQLGNGIDNATAQEDDYLAVLDWVREQV